VAVADERTHAELFGQRHGVTVIVLGCFDLWGIAA